MRSILWPLARKKVKLTQQAAPRRTVTPQCAPRTQRNEVREHDFDERDHRARPKRSTQLHRVTQPMYACRNNIRALTASENRHAASPSLSRYRRVIPIATKSARLAIRIGRMRSKSAPKGVEEWRRRGYPCKSLLILGDTTDPMLIGAAYTSDPSSDSLM